MINDIYRNKKVLVTGHTGFKGAWLSLWLSKMGAEVIGLSDSVPTNPSHFVAGGIESIVETHFADIRDARKVTEIIQSVKPDFCLLYTSPSPRDQRGSRMPSSA